MVKSSVEFVRYESKISISIICLSVATLFLYLNHVQPQYFIDEVFHVPQTLRYCAGNFSQDPKITTLPGLYLITTAVLSPLNLCNTFYMRCVNLIGTFFNLYLAYNVIKQISISHWEERWSDRMRLAVACNITLFPPLFFWHFLYYTDVVSVNAILLMLLLHLRKRFTIAAIVGISSVLMRQTNIIWVAFISVERAFDLIDRKVGKSIPREQHRSVDYLKLVCERIIEEAQSGWKSFAKFLIYLSTQLLPYILACLLFIAFIVWNKGIVVGDRAAHVATVHIPQLLYFSAFQFCFSWPYAIVHWKDYFKFITKHWAFTICSLIVLTAIVHFNTRVHPYVLADNRHYVFYFWNKFMGRYRVFKYLLVPVYTFTLFTLLRGIEHLRFTTQINYVVMVSIVLVPQLLIEPRYFIIPYVLYRCFITKPRGWQIVAESVTTLIVNFLQFYIFVNRVFYWDDQPYPQRIAW